MRGAWPYTLVFAGEGNFRDKGVLSSTPDLRDATCDPVFHFANLCVLAASGQGSAQSSPPPPPPFVVVTLSVGEWPWAALVPPGLLLGVGNEEWP